MEATQHKGQRIGIFIDVQNMYYSAKNLYSCKVNFHNILKDAIAGRKLIRAFAYVIKADVKDESNFFEALEKMGIEIRAKDLQTFFGGAKKGDWDVGIAMDMVRLAPKIDTAILISGDGDFKDCLEYVSSVGCRTEAMAFGKSASIRIKEEADMFFDMDKNKDKYLIKGSIRRAPARKPARAAAKPAAKPAAKAAPKKAGGPPKLNTPKPPSFNEQKGSEPNPADALVDLG